MQPRPERIDVPDRRPYVRIVVADGPAVTLRLPDLTQHATTTGRVQRATVGVLQVVRRVQEAVESGDVGWGAEDELEAAHRRLAAAYGLVIARTWADPDLELDVAVGIETARNAGQPYVSACGVDGWEGLGLDAYQELGEAGWSPGQIAAIASELVRQSTAWLHDGKVTEEVKRKAADFPQTP